MKPAIAASNSASVSAARLLLAVLATLLLAAGCGHHSQSDTSSVDPQTAETLSRLTTELHHAMVGRKLNRNFDEFVAMQHLEVPPPPAGKKYAINEKWKVVLVDR